MIIFGFVSPAPFNLPERTASLARELTGGAILPLFVCAVLTATVSVAAEYPNRPIRYVIPSAAGAGPTQPRASSLRNSAGRWGSNSWWTTGPGGSGTIGTEVIARAAPDGYTIGHGNILTLALNRSVLPRLPYHPDKDLQPVVNMYATPDQKGSREVGRCSEARVR